MSAAMLVEALRAVVGDRHVLTDADLRAAFEVDWTRRFGGPALAVVRWLTAARGADEVAAMRGVKAALDQAGVLNPGVVLTT